MTSPRVLLRLTEMEVVVLSVSDPDDDNNGVDDSYSSKVSRKPIKRCVLTHTCGTWILSEVLGPVSADQSRGLDFRS